MNYPGTVIETEELTKDKSRTLFQGIFATGGITLSQIGLMAGLENHTVQNWVKRGFVSSPKGRVYSKDQFARIVIINMLKESLTIDNICALIGHINGALDDESDDRICDSELYHRYVDMIISIGKTFTSPEEIRTAAREACEDYSREDCETYERLCDVLYIMAYSHFCAEAKKEANKALANIRSK